MKTVPIIAALIAPSGLNAWEKFKRRAALSGSPSWAMKGLEAVSKKESPLAMTKSANKKKP